MQSRVLPMLRPRESRPAQRPSVSPSSKFCSRSDEVSVLMMIRSRSETFLFRSCRACPTTLRSLLLHTPVGPAPAADAWFFSRDVDVLLLLQRLKLMIAPPCPSRVVVRRLSPRMPLRATPVTLLVCRDVVQSPLRSLCLLTSSDAIA